MENLLYTGNVTDLGKAKLTRAMQTGEPVKITHMAVGDGSGSVPNPTADITGLLGEVWRGAVAVVEIDPDEPYVLWVRASIPESGPGGFWVREMGAYDQDGDLIAYAPVPEAYKPNRSTGATTGFYFDLAIVTSSIEAIEITVDTGGVQATRKDIELHNLDPEAHPVLDCGYFTEGYAELTVHKALDTAHRNLLVDGNAIAAVSGAPTLGDHEADPNAHQNIVLDGNTTEASPDALNLAGHETDPTAHQNMVLDGNEE